MKIEATPISDLLIIQPEVHGDERGFFAETWNHKTFHEMGLDIEFVQDNHSRSSQGTLRGLHYQTERPQGKLVRCTQGEVYDVAVDMRGESPTFGHSYGLTLSAANFTMLWVPPGFAHGFYVISETADFQYKCSDFYHPEFEVSLDWADPHLAIQWPIPVGGAPSLSAKDSAGLSFSEAPYL